MNDIISFMELTNREIGSELSVVEKELIFNDKYANTGFVKYDTRNGEYFFLHPSPFLNTPKKEIYHISNSPPPEHKFIEANIIEEKQVSIGNSNEKWLLKEVDSWKLFDPTPLAQKRKIMDYEEIIEFFTYPYKGEMESVEEIAGCSSLFAFSSPPDESLRGGISSAVLGKDKQWKLFNEPLNIIPKEFRQINSDYYYYISKREKNFKNGAKEVNIAVHRPKTLLSDIPIVILDESEKKHSKEFIEQLQIEAKIIIPHILDGLLLEPHASKQVEDLIFEQIVDMRESYYQTGQLPFNQNIGGSVRKLASSYCRLQSSSKINKKDVNIVVDLWYSMWNRAKKLESSSLKRRDMLYMLGDSRIIYLKLLDIFGAESKISMIDGAREVRMDPIEFELAIEILIERGYCIRINNFIILLEPYKKRDFKRE